MRRGFTLFELLVVISIVVLLSLLALPALRGGLEASRKAACASNLRQLYVAYLSYMEDHDGRFFPMKQAVEGGTLWYWGLESGLGREGSRKLDRSQARLAPYLGVRTVETCPSFPYSSTAFKRKYETASYGYGLNVFLLSDTPEARRAGISSWSGLARPDRMLIWGDAAQINMFQAPASPQNPMLEEWYYLASRSYELPTYHFRHQKRMQMVFGDGSIKGKSPHAVLPYVDGQVGYLEPRGSDYFLTAILAEP